MTALPIDYFLFEAIYAVVCSSAAMYAYVAKMCAKMRAPICANKMCSTMYSFVCTLDPSTHTTSQGRALTFRPWYLANPMAQFRRHVCSRQDIVITLRANSFFIASVNISHPAHHHCRRLRRIIIE